MKPIQYPKAFTFVEASIVIAIIGVLSLAVYLNVEWKRRAFERVTGRPCSWWDAAVLTGGK